MVKRNNKFN